MMRRTVVAEPDTTREELVLSHESLRRAPTLKTRCHMATRLLALPPFPAAPLRRLGLSPFYSPPCPSLCVGRVSVLLNGKKRKARPKGINLKVRWRAKFAMRYRCGESAPRAILVWECSDRSPRRSVGKGACVFSCGYDPTPGQGNP